MVEIINDTILTTSASMTDIRGVCLHNDAGSMTPAQYVEWLKTRDLTKGIAHYYINRNAIARVVDTNKQAWHTANTDGNGHYIGYEVCESLKVIDVDFLLNEDMVFRQMAEDLKFYGLPANADTVRMHQDFKKTDCPHRSLSLHGGAESLRSYAIDKINHYMSLGDTVADMISTPTVATPTQNSAPVAPVRVPVSYNATITSGGYSIDSKPWGEASSENWGKTDDQIGEVFYFYEENASGEYANALGLGWVDKRAIEKEKQVVASILFLPNGQNWTIYPSEGPYQAGDVISLEAEGGSWFTILGERNGSKVLIVDLPNFGTVGIYFDQDKGASISKKYA